MSVDYRVFCAFDLTNYVDITQFVKDFDIERGRSYELDEHDAATLSLTLDNADGQFTPNRQGIVNLAVNPGMEVDTSGIDITGATNLVRITGWTNTGSYAGQITSDGVTDPTIRPWAGWSGGHGLVAAPGDIVRVKVRVRRSGAGLIDSYRAEVQWLDAANASLGSVLGTLTALDNGGEATLSLTTTAAPAGTARARVIIRGRQGNALPPAGELFRWDSLVITRNQEIPTGVDYFDGNSPGCSWIGTAGVSQSQYGFYPNVKPKRPIKVEADSVSLFNGKIEKWPVQIEGNTSDVAVTAVDAYTDYASLALKRPLAEVIMAAKPKRYYPLSDGPDTIYPGDWGTDNTPGQLITSKYGGFLTMGNTSLFESGEGSISGGALNIGGAPGTGYKGGALKVPLGENTSDTFQTVFTFELKSQTALTNEEHGTQILYAEHIQGANWSVDQPHRMITLEYGSGVFNFRFRYGTNWLLSPNDVNGGGTWAPLSQSVKYHMWFKTTATGGNRTIDYALYPATSTTPIVSGTKSWAEGADTTVSAHAYFGGDPMLRWNPGQNQSVNLSNVVMHWGGAFTGSFVQTDIPLINAGLSKTDEAYVSFLNSVTGNRTLTTLGPLSQASILDAPNWEDETLAIDLFRNFGNSVGGSVYLGADGGLVYETRQYRLSAASVATFQDTAGFASVEAGLLFEQDEDRIGNDTTVTQRGASVLRSVDAASVAEFGRKTLERETDVLSGLEAQDYADWLTYLRKDALTRCDQVEINCSAQEAYMATFLALKLSSKITLAGLPSQAPYLSAEFFVEGIGVTVDVTGETPEMNMQLQLSPGDKMKAWVLEDDTYGLLDDTSIVCY